MSANSNKTREQISVIFKSDADHQLILPANTKKNDLLTCMDKAALPGKKLNVVIQSKADVAELHQELPRIATVLNDFSSYISEIGVDVITPNLHDEGDCNMADAQYALHYTAKALAETNVKLPVKLLFPDNLQGLIMGQSDLKSSEADLLLIKETLQLQLQEKMAIYKPHLA